MCKDVVATDPGEILEENGSPLQSEGSKVKTEEVEA